MLSEEQDQDGSRGRQRILDLKQSPQLMGSAESTELLASCCIVAVASVILGLSEIRD